MSSPAHYYGSTTGDMPMFPVEVMEAERWNRLRQRSSAGAYLARCLISQDESSDKNKPPTELWMITDSKDSNRLSTKKGCRKESQSNAMHADYKAFLLVLQFLCTCRLYYRSTLPLIFQETSPITCLSQMALTCDDLTEVSCTGNGRSCREHNVCSVQLIVIWKYHGLENHQYLQNWCAVSCNDKSSFWGTDWSMAANWDLIETLCKWTQYFPPN